jgi:hypothetical protein
MKKSILALSAAAAVSGLGFAGSAHALAYFGPPNTPPGIPAAQTEELNQGGTGHMLFVPYITTQNNHASLVHINNTDMVNGKAVKVRFRSAANSDDILDFTVYLSPGDMWTAMIAEGTDGRSLLTSGDKSCTIPTIPAVGVPFRTTRLPSYLTPEAKATHTREGYVEILNMADIPPPSALYTAIKHVNGVAPCTSSAFDPLRTVPATMDTAAIAETAGLRAPTGQLMGSWTLMDQTKAIAHGGVDTAIRAVDNNGANAYGNIMFAPQFEAVVGLPQVSAGGASIRALTADPLLRADIIPTLWLDLPDMSTPMYPAAYSDANPIAQVAAMSAALAKNKILNEYFTTADGVPMATDWVISQPTRRYHVAVEYGNALAGAKLWWNPVIRVNTPDQGIPTDIAPSSTNNAYGIALLQKPAGDAMGPYACVPAQLEAADREERLVAAKGPDDSFSPADPLPPTPPFCGEASILQFGEGVLGGMVDVTVVDPEQLSGPGGWARWTMGDGVNPLPAVGYAATSITNAASSINFGTVMPHRW